MVLDFFGKSLALDPSKQILTKLKLIVTIMDTNETNIFLDADKTIFQYKQKYLTQAFGEKVKVELSTADCTTTENGI